MSVTVDKTTIVQGVPLPTTEVQLSALTAGELEDVSHGGPAGVRVQHAHMEILTRPTDGSDIRMERSTADDVLSLQTVGSDTIALRFYTEAGGSLTGAIVKVRFEFGALKSGGFALSATRD